MPKKRTCEQYNHQIALSVTPDGIAERLRALKGPIRRFSRNRAGQWEPIEHPGYTIITPTLEDECRNIKVYATLSNVQQALLQRLPLSQFAPVPVTAFHLTVADLVSRKTFPAARQRAFLEALCSVFIGLTLPGTVGLRLHGVSLFKKGAVVVMAAAEDAAGYRRLTSFRNAVYADPRLRSFGVNRKGRFTGHVTLAYIEARKDNLDHGKLLRTVNTVNRRFFKRPLPFEVVRAEVRKFRNMGAFARSGGWPVFEFLGS